MSELTQDQSLEALIARLQGDITSLINVMFRGIEERLAPSGLAVGEYSVLTACLANEPITISSLTRHVPVDVGRMSRIVSDLKAKGLVRRVRLRRDRRAVTVRTTDEGRALASQLMGRVGEHYANATRRMTEEELDDLITFIEKMTRNAEFATEQSGNGSPQG